MDVHTVKPRLLCRVDAIFGKVKNFFVIQISRELSSYDDEISLLNFRGMTIRPTAIHTRHSKNILALVLATNSTFLVENPCVLVEHRIVLLAFFREIKSY